MLIALTLAAAVAGQSAPPAHPASETRHEVRIVTSGGPGGPGGRQDMDKNDDGFVTREEFTAPQTAAFEMLDTNSDGRISTEEFASGRAAAHVILGGPDGPGAAGGPMRFHMSGPGAPGGHGPMGEGNVTVIRRGGPDGGMAPMGPMGAGRNIQIHTIGGPGHDGPGDLDKDGDGKVSEAEFLAPLREAFQRMDADRSGSLEAGEHGPGGGGNVFIMRRDGPDAPSAD